MWLKAGIAFAAGGFAFVFCKHNVLASSSGGTIKWDENWDKRCHQKPKATRYILLIRHGQYYRNVKTSSEKSLTDLGKEQSILTGKRLKELGLDKKITCMFASTKTRASETFNLIFKQLENNLIPCEHTDFLHEGIPYELEPPVTLWMPKPQVCFVDRSKLEMAFRHFIHRADIEQENDSVEVFVCHGNLIGYFVCRALQLSPETLVNITLQHGSITQLAIRPNGKVFLKALGDVGHLPPDKLTFV